jgi:lambda family phage portal protein
VANILQKLKASAKLALMPWGAYQRRDAAKRTGSMSNWNPTTIYSDSVKAMERTKIVDRSTNLVHDDPNAAGIIDTFATTITGAGLRPVPALNPDILGITPVEARRIESEQKSIYKEWQPWADAGERMTDGAIQHLKTRCLFEFGESLDIIYMLNDPARPYAMASMVIDPRRLKTPTDLMSREDIKDGVEIGKYGAPIAYWIQKAGNYATSSSNFIRFPARKGHRWQVLHDFISKDPEQMRGDPILATGMRFFRDFADLLGSELTSGVVSAAIGLFVESGADAYQTAQNLMDPTADRPDDERWQSIDPGEIWYGKPGEKPNLISPDRPGNTFDPFTKLIKKAISQGAGVPYNVLFKDLDGVAFAGFRAAMLEAWRTYSYHRTRIGNADLQRKYTMLMEEAWARGRLTIGSDFFDKMQLYTAAEWVGAPKGDIEPFKAAQADIMKVSANIKTLERAIIEDGGAGFTEVTDQRAEENSILTDKDLPIPGQPATAPSREDDETQ